MRRDSVRVAVVSHNGEAMTPSKPRWPREQALAVARELQAVLEPVCKPSRCVVAGSLRRGKQDVGDVEFLFVGRKQVMRDGLFDVAVIDLAERVIEKMLATGVLAKRLSAKGLPAWGEKNKLAVHVASGVPIDFFSTTEENWFCSLVIRTGGAEMNRQLAMGALKIERNLQAYGPGVVLNSGRVIRAESEEHLFELCGLRYRKPEDRP